MFSMSVTIVFEAAAVFNSEHLGRDGPRATVVSYGCTLESLRESFKAFFFFFKLKHS